MVAVLYPVAMVYYINRVLGVKPTLHFWDKSCLVMVYNSFLYVAGFNLLVFC